MRHPTVGGLETHHPPSFPVPPHNHAGAQRQTYIVKKVAGESMPEGAAHRPALLPSTTCSLCSSSCQRYLLCLDIALHLSATGCSFGCCKQKAAMVIPGAVIQATSVTHEPDNEPDIIATEAPNDTPYLSEFRKRTWPDGGSDYQGPISFLLQNPGKKGFRRVSERVSEGVSEGFAKCF